MLKKIVTLVAASLILSACASPDAPRIVQPTVNMPEVRLVSGMATQVELPDSNRVQSLVTGNPDLVVAQEANGVVSLMPKAGIGETNLIIRSVDEDGRGKVYQYRVIVQGP